eukprot:14222991-Ditylum_brightwellii.AAC.1
MPSTEISSHSAKPSLVEGTKLHPNSKYVGPNEVGFTKTAVEQLWEEAKGVIHELNDMVLPSLELLL